MDHAALQEHPRLDWHLDNWARYLRSDDFGNLRCGTSRYWTTNVDFDIMADHMENYCARIVDSLVNDLPARQRASVVCRCLGTRAFADDATITALYGTARLTISAGLIKRGVS